MPDQAGVQHVPRRQAEVAAHHHRQRDAVQHQADVELRQPARQAAGAQLGDRAEVGEAGAGGVASGRHAAQPDRGLAFSSIANRGTVACMTGSISAARVATLVGDFDRSPAYAGLADALVLLIGDGRIGLGHPAAQRARAHRRPRRLAHHGDPGVRRAARRRVRRGPPRRRHLHPRARAAGPAPTTGRCSPAPATRRRSTSTARPPPRRPGSRRRTPTAAADLPAYLGGHGYFPAGLPRAAGARSRRRTTPAACPPTPTRSWSPPAR